MATLAVESDLALARLRYELANFHPEVRQRGQSLFKGDAVYDLEVDRPQSTRRISRSSCRLIGDNEPGSICTHLVTY